MHWHHSLILTHMSGDSRCTHKIIQPQNYCFQPITVSFYTYTFIFMHDRTLGSLLLSLTCLNMPGDKTITQTIFVVQFTSRSFPHLGRPMDTSSSISLRYSSATSFPLTISSHYRYNMMSKFEFFFKDPGWWGKTYASLGGCLDICPPLDQLHLASETYPELSSLTSLRAWGDMEKSCSNMAYLVVSAEDEVMSDREYGLSTVWADLFQARVFTVKEVVQQLTALVSSGHNWPYVLVQLNEDTHHVPLPKEGHQGIMTEGGTNSATCGQVSQLEVHQLLSSGPQVVYLMGLNGCEAPVIALLPKSLARDTTLLGGKPTYQKVSIPQPTPVGHEPKVLPHSSHSSPIQMPSPIKAPTPKVEREISMTMEVRELLSQAVLDTSGHSSGYSAPQIWRSFWSSGHIIPGECPRWYWDGGSLPGGIPCCPLPIAETPRASSGTPTKDAGHLWKEANKTLGELLATKLSINAHWQKLVLELGMGLCQNESKTTKSIKEAKVVCDTAIREAKATCVLSIQEAKTHSSMAIKDTEACRAS